MIESYALIHVLSPILAGIAPLQASVTYDARERHYVITQTSDVAQDTRVNDDPLSSTATGATSVTLAGYVRALKHDDVLGVGGTRLLCHVHDGMDTCDDCEPGIVRAKINEVLAKEKAVWRENKNKDAFLKTECRKQLGSRSFGSGTTLWVT